MKLSLLALRKFKAGGIQVLKSHNWRSKNLPAKDQQLGEPQAGLLGGVNFIEPEKMQTPEGINPENLRDLGAKLGGPDEQVFIGELVDTFLRLMPIRLNDMQKCINEEIHTGTQTRIGRTDFRALERVAHTTKTAALTVGAERLGILMSMIEKAAQLNSDSGLAELLRLSLSEYSLVQEQLRQMCPK